jgi:hypothetical protein
VFDYDPVIQTRSVRAHFNHRPEAAVAVVAPSLEVPVASQHAIAYETFQTLGSARFDIVTSAKRWSPQSDNKIRKLESAGGPRELTALDDALEIALGKRSGIPVDEAAAAVVYACTSRATRRTPFRCTPLQRQILRVLASGEIPPTTSAIADAVYARENRVYDSITELADALVPRGVGEPDRRDSRERLYLLLHRYGVWIRLVDERQKRQRLHHEQHPHPTADLRASR